MDVIKSIDAFLLKVGKQDRLVTLFFIMMITIATFLRFYGIGDASLWLDEVLTITLSDLPFSTLWISNYDPTPPLYYSLMKLTLIFGDSHLLLRAPSAIFGILTVVAVYFMMRDIFNKKAAFASALLLSFSIAQIEYSQEARAYAMLTFFCCGIVWSTLGILIKDNDQNVTTKKYFILYFISASMSLYTHNVAVFFVFAANLSMLFYFFLSRKINIMTWWVTVNIILLLVWLPWLENVISGVSGGNNFNWLKHVSLTDFLIITFDLHRYYLITKFQPFLDYAFMGVLFYGLLKLRKDPKIFICIISFLLCSTFLLWLVGYIKPIFMNRTIVPSGII
ncbi:MAG: putative membrane protein, partial [Francisellaceae bacterium]